MSSQPNITRFFNSRKRAASSLAPSRSKLLILEAQGALKQKQQVAVEVTPLQPPPGATQLGAKAAQDAPKKGQVVRSLDFNVNAFKKKIAANATARDKLKTSLDRFQKLDAKLKIKPFEGALEIELPESPIKKPIYASPLKSPVKSPVKSCTQSPSKARVSLKFESEKEGLALPQSYQLLHASFKAMDVAACMLENRKEKVTLSKVTTAVEQITRMNFGRDKLGQIKTVDPDSVEFKMMKDDLELEMSFTKDSQGKSWSCLANREKGFKSKLVDLVKQYHQEFLAQLRPPLEIPSDKVMRWHPEFEPNLVPLIKSAALPENSSKKFYTASEVLDANSWLKTNTRVSQALAKLKSEGQSEQVPSLKEEEPMNPNFKGLPASLLAKVRQKQAEKARLASIAITRPTDKEEEHRRLERLPVMAKYIRNIFVSEKKSVLRQELLIEKLSNCFPFPLTNDEYEKHIELIIKGAPHWVEKITLRKDVFIRVIKRVEFEHLQKALEAMIQSNI